MLILSKQTLIQVYIVNNQNLTTLAENNTGAGPGTLETISGRLTIGNNPRLTSLAGLEGLKSVGGSVSTGTPAKPWFCIVQSLYFSGFHICNAHLHPPQIQ